MHLFHCCYNYNQLHAYKHAQISIHSPNVAIESLKCHAPHVHQLAIWAQRTQWRDLHQFAKKSYCNQIWLYGHSYRGSPCLLTWNCARNWDTKGKHGIHGDCQGLSLRCKNSSAMVSHVAVRLGSIGTWGCHHGNIPNSSWPNPRPEKYDLCHQQSRAARTNGAK